MVVYPSCWRWLCCGGCGGRRELRRPAASSRSERVDYKGRGEAKDWGLAMEYKTSNARQGDSWVTVVQYGRRCPKYRIQWGWVPGVVINFSEAAACPRPPFGIVSCHFQGPRCQGRQRQRQRPRPRPRPRQRQLLRHMGSTSNTGGSASAVRGTSYLRLYSLRQTLRITT